MIHSPPESTANLIYPLQALPTHNHSDNQRDTKITFYQPPHTLFPQQLSKLPGISCSFSIDSTNIEHFSHQQ